MYGKKNTDKPKKKTLPYNPNAPKAKKTPMPAIKGEKPKRKTMPYKESKSSARSLARKAMPRKRTYPNIGRG